MSRSFKQTWITAVCLFGLIAISATKLLADTGCDTTASTTVGSRMQSEPAYEGRPLSYWIKVIRDRDGRMPMALEAIQSLGPQASQAVPVLEAIVAEPFIPVKVGADDNDILVAKLLQIQLRGNAVDALAAIGPAADCSTKTLIRWALTLRVVPVNLESARANSLFAEMVGVDVLERMRVVGAVPELGLHALTITAQAVTSKDPEKRKLAVAILAERTLPIAVSLLRSRDCDEKMLGLAILGDMWPVVPEVHLANLKDSFVCDAN